MSPLPKQPTIAEWKRLYEKAIELKNLAPWEWMEEIDIFGVENPSSKEIGFVSVMGVLGEHKALAVYLGADALYEFWDLQDEESPLPESLALFEIPQIQVSFEDRENLDKQDVAIIKKLGLKFKGPQSWPMFRSFKPGFMPWIIDSDEARMLINVAGQTLAVAPRVKEGSLSLTVEDDPKDEIYLIRTSKAHDGKVVWRDEMQRISRPPKKKTQISISPRMVEQLKTFPQNHSLVFEMDLFAIPLPIGKKGERPMLPKMLMVSDAGSFFILGTEIIEPTKNIDESYSSVADSLLKIWSEHRILPGEIHVGSRMLFNLLRAFTQQLNIKVRQTNQLFAIEDARNALIDQILGPGL